MNNINYANAERIDRNLHVGTTGYQYNIHAVQRVARVLCARK